MDVTTVLCVLSLLGICLLSTMAEISAKVPPPPPPRPVGEVLRRGVLACLAWGAGMVAGGGTLFVLGVLALPGAASTAVPLLAGMVGVAWALWAGGLYGLRRWSGTRPPASPPRHV